MQLACLVTSLHDALLRTGDHHLSDIDPLLFTTLCMLGLHQLHTLGAKRCLAALRFLGLMTHQAAWSVTATNEQSHNCCSTGQIVASRRWTERRITAFGLLSHIGSC